MAALRTTAKVTSTTFRTVVYLALRHFPAHLPLIAITLFVAYAPLFYQNYRSDPEFKEIDDKINVSVTETTVAAEDAGDEEGDVVADEIELEETILLAEDVPSAQNVVLFGAPNSKRPLASLLTLLINVLLVCFTADALFRSRFCTSEDLSFVRLGFVSNAEAKFLVREPNQLEMPLSLEIRNKDTGGWRLGGVVHSTTNETDFTGVLNVRILFSQHRQWEWRTSNHHHGEFITPPKPGALPEDGKFTFVSTSCILNHFPYNPLNHPLSIPGLRYLATKLPELQAQFMLFLGDFIYVDVPERFGKTIDEYRMQYRQMYASPDWPSVSQNLSWIHVWDDHEISNDWSSQKAGVYRSAVDPWNIYHTSVNPPKAGRANATWFQFVQGPAAFFMLDTRSYRSSNNLPFEQEDKSMLGGEQLADLVAWLYRAEPQGVHWKVVASSIPFTKNWPVNTKETWGGFLVERRKVLEAMWDAGARGYGVIILSGDRHEFAATKFPPPLGSRWPETAVPYEFSTSPLNQFSSPIKTYRQTDDEDVMLRYIPRGNSKFGSFTFETIAGQPTLLYRLFVQGKESWNTLITVPSVDKTDNTLGSFWNKLFR